MLAFAFAEICLPPISMASSASDCLLLCSALNVEMIESQRHLQCRRIHRAGAADMERSGGDISGLAKSKASPKIGDQPIRAQRGKTGAVFGKRGNRQTMNFERALLRCAVIAKGSAKGDRAGTPEISTAESNDALRRPAESSSVNVVSGETTNSPLASSLNAIRASRMAKLCSEPEPWALF